MPVVIKPLGQSAPILGSYAVLYEVPSTIQTVISSILVCNQSDDDAQFTVAVAPEGEETDSKHYVYFENEIPGKETFSGVLGITLSGGFQVRVESSNGEMSFSLFGQESGFMEGELMEWLTGEKLTGVHAGIQGQKSVTNDYLYLCVIGGEAGVAVWKKLLMSKSE